LDFTRAHRDLRPVRHLVTVALAMEEALAKLEAFGEVESVWCVVKFR
jgi:hypothetical protein